jgi:hypothetical protein
MDKIGSFEQALLRAKIRRALEARMKWDIDVSVDDIKGKIILEEGLTDRGGYTEAEKKIIHDCFAPTLERFGRIFMAVILSGKRVSFFLWYIDKKMNEIHRLMEAAIKKDKSAN